MLEVVRYEYDLELEFLVFIGFYMQNKLASESRKLVMWPVLVAF